MAGTGGIMVAGVGIAGMVQVGAGAGIIGMAQATTDIMADGTTGMVMATTVIITEIMLIQTEEEVLMQIILAEEATIEVTEAEATAIIL